MTNTNIISRVNVPYRLSVVAMAVIGINAATLSNSVWAEDAINLDAITVTGEKVDKDIKDTTTAVTVITEEQYESGESKDVNDIVTQAPNVTTSGFGTVNIRGVNGAGPAVGANAFLTGGSPRISTSVDGVTQSWAGYDFTPSGLWDAQQVEVLRGPQSTSQGTNAIGGAIVIKTNDPSFTPESAVRVGLEQYKNSNIKYNLAGMNSGTLIEDELAYRITFSGTKGEGWMNYDTTDDDAIDVNDSSSQNYQAKLLWTPKNISGLTAKLNISHRENDGEYLSWASNTETQTLDLDNNNTRLQDSTVDIISTEIGYQINDEVKNILQVSYNKQDAYFEEWPGSTILEKTEEKISLENRLLITPKNSDISGMIGFYAEQSDSTLDVDFDWFDNAYLSDGTKTTLALYGESTYAVTDKLAITAGGRIHNENQDRTLDMYPGASYGGNLDQDTTETVFLPKVSATYDITDKTTLGASVRRGYNSGGAALNWDDKTYYTYDKEEVTAYELSSKTRFNNMSVNASLFYNDYTGYQAYTSDTLENLKSAHTYGAEVELVAQVSNDLELRGSIGTLQTKVDATDSDTSSWKGNELTYSPDLNLGLGFTQYVGSNWSFGADANYVSEYYSDLDNDDAYTAGDYVIFNTRVKYELGDITIDGYIKNLTNEDIIYLQRSSTSSVGQTRTIGLSATYRL